MTRPQTKEPEQTCLTYSPQTLWGKGNRGWGTVCVVQYYQNFFCTLLTVILCVWCYELFVILVALTIP